MSCYFSPSSLCNALPKSLVLVDLIANLICAEMSEADVVSSLCSIQGSRFAYSLINGMVGMYNEYHRQWRTKVSIKVETVSVGSLQLEVVVVNAIMYFLLS